MSIYSTGSEAFRDTTKWLVAFVPIATVVAAGGVLLPRLATGAATSHSLMGWLVDNVYPMAGILVIVVGIVLIVSFGARVLSIQPENFAELMTTDDARLSAAFSSGVGAPYFLEDRQFRQAVATLDAQWSAGNPVAEPDLARAVAATEMLRAWSLQQALADAFGAFRTAFGIGIVMIAGGLTVASATLPEPAGVIESPTVVQVSVQSAGAADLLRATGCTSPTETEFFAVAGTWTAPVLEVDGPDCRFGARWKPEAAGVELRPDSKQLDTAS